MALVQTHPPPGLDSDWSCSLLRAVLSHFQSTDLIFLECRSKIPPKLPLGCGRRVGPSLQLAGQDVELI